ncbi:MAG: MazG nucleotide pyrophosphohydrolase domain-containing protein [Thermoproteota archaeon]
MGLLNNAWNRLVKDVKRTWILEFEDENEELLFLSNALAGECGELANEVKKWFRAKLVDDTKVINKQQLSIESELMDILYYIVKISSVLNIDVEKAWVERLKVNEERWKEFKKRKHL